MSTIDQEPEQYPIEPRYHPIHKIPRQIYDLLASAKLAMALLIVILASCVTGVTIYRGQAAYEHIFSSLWFNALLVLLVVNVACCFFGRVWGRRVTVISFGMILFHLSFVAVFLGVAYNSMFYFRGTIRLTEGEALPNNDPASYDQYVHGRFFRFSALKGETTLHKMHVGYKDDGKDKRVAYEVEVGEGARRKREIIYITKYLEYRGVKYFRDKEGYSLLLVLTDSLGKVLYGAYVPLQSYKQKDESYRYATGTKELESGIPFPQEPVTPLLDVLTVYTPSKLKEQGGDVEFVVRPPAAVGAAQSGDVIARGKVAVESPFPAGAYLLTAREVRYWAAMQVSYEPGQPIILGSLWVGLAGMLITTVGRMVRGRK